MDLYQQIFFTTLALAFAVLHFLLFFYNRRLKSNLYFSLFLLFYALNIFFDFQSSLATRPEYEIIFIRVHRAVLPFNPIFALLFTYTALGVKIPKQFWIISLGLIITGMLAVYKPMDNFAFIQVFLVAVFIEAARVFTSAVYNKKENALIITVGFSLLFLFSFYDMLMDLGFINPIYNIHNGYPFGFFFLTISVSISLARDFSRINQKVLDQEVKQRLLEAEDARKSKELEEARQIQLSMLPSCLPDMKGLDICFDMRTATEVGGDYYDYVVDTEGGLTIAIGDATGHGMKAGLMVSIIKSLFVTYASEQNIIDFFHRVSRTIRQMNFNNLFMSLMLVKIKDGRLIASSAGMPPILLYKDKSKSIQELKMKGMPLGAVESFPYEKIEIFLEKGDVLLLMSDGFPELFNDRDELLDETRVKQIFTEVAEKSSNQIIDHLFKSADRWRGERALHDDITFVVCKVI